MRASAAQVAAARAAGAREAASGALRAASGAEAYEAILAPLKFKGTVRSGWFGTSMYGKSFGLRAVLEELLRRGGAQLALILDDKGPQAQYRGTEYAGVAEFLRAPPKAGTYPAAVFRGSWKGGRVSAEELAQLARALGKRGVRVVLVLDEMRRALTPSGAAFAAPTMQWIFSEGRVVGISCLWTTQSPKRCLAPEPYDEATTLQFHRLASKATNYLRENTDVDEELLDAATSLDPNQPPPSQRGHFLVYTPGGEWDRRVYRF